MNIIVCIKQVPDTAAKIRINPDGKSIDLTNVEFIISPYDEYAIEEALRIKEAKGGMTTVITFGPDRASQALRHALAMGIDEAIHIISNDAETSDSWITANVLASLIKSLNYDIILFGKQGVGTDNSQVPSIVAELLQVPQALAVSKLDIISENIVNAHFEVEGGMAVYEILLPAVISTEKGINEPRYPTLKGIMASKKKIIKQMTPSDLGFDENQIGEKGSKVLIRKLNLPPARTAGKILTGEAKETVAQLVSLLRKEAKVI